MTRRRLFRALCCAALLAMLALPRGFARSSPDPPVIARVTITSPCELARFVALGLDVPEMREGDDLFVVTTLPVVVETDEANCLASSTRVTVTP